MEATAGMDIMVKTEASNCGLNQEPILTLIKAAGEETAATEASAVVAVI